MNGALVAAVDDRGGNYARQIERLIRDVGSLRDDMRVLTAIVMRLDNSQGAMLQELRETMVRSRA